MDRVLKRLIREAIQAEKYATDWDALNKVKRKPGITKSPHMQAWYGQMAAERKVAHRVFELIDIYRLKEDERRCLLEALRYHSYYTNLYPIKSPK